MSYTLTVTEENGYLHAVISGRNSKDNVTGYLQDLVRECVARQCFRVLIEERLEGPRLRTLDVYQIASGSDRARQTIKELAFVDVHAEGELMKFAETVAVNRGLPVRMFLSVDAARAWLLRDRSTSV